MPIRCLSVAALANCQPRREKKVLQDPAVATAPLEKRIAFLQSKELTQEEVDASLARAGGPGAGVGAAASAAAGGYGYYGQHRAAPYGGPSDGRYGYWKGAPLE